MCGVVLGIGIKMHNNALLVTVGIIYSLVPKVLPIDCYFCNSINGAMQECEDSFLTDLSTVHLISRECSFGYFKAQYCTKLKGKRVDGTSILLRQCSMDDYGQHCGLIQFQVGDNLEKIEGCLETCHQDGCNFGIVHKCNPVIATFPVMLGLLSFVGFR